MRAHGVKQKPSVCEHTCVPIMNMYGSFCGRYVRVLFAPRSSCVRARSKDAAHLPFSLHPPPLSHVHFPSLLIFLFLFLPFLSLSLSLSHLLFFSCLSLFLHTWIMRPCLILHRLLFSYSDCVTFISGCDRAAILIAYFFEMLCTIRFFD